ncbi:MAG: hypothetical protein KC535_02640 [Nanoarchaeota archaeon]|nr:hypothetical protein [Nanoarchaeota archaeon]
MFFQLAELQERIVHIERYLDGKEKYMWPQATGNPWQERWIREYLSILREEYFTRRRLSLDKSSMTRILK